MAETYTCSACGAIGEKGWSDGEADAEARAVFGRDRQRDPSMVLVCDDCYKAMTMAIPPKEWVAKQV